MVLMTFTNVRGIVAWGGADAMMLARGPCKLSSCATCSELNGTDVGTVSPTPSLWRNFNNKLKSCLFSLLIEGAPRLSLHRLLLSVVWVWRTPS